MNSDGSNIKTCKVAVTKKTRDWWPIAAASNDKSLLVWQRYVNKHKYCKLCYALYDPQSNTLRKINGHKTTVISKMKVKYYTYNVTYLTGINHYLINVTTAHNSGIALLLDSNGNISTIKYGFPAFVRESSPAILKKNDSYILCYPRSPSGCMYMKVTENKIKYLGLQSGNKWSYRGTSGFFSNNDTYASFATLTKKAVKLYKYKALSFL